MLPTQRRFKRYHYPDVVLHQGPRIAVNDDADGVKRTRIASANTNAQRCQPPVVQFQSPVIQILSPMLLLLLAPVEAITLSIWTNFKLQQIIPYDAYCSYASPTLTPFGDSDFLLFEEADSFLALEDDPTSSEVDPTYQDPEGDILLLEAILNSEPPPPLPNHEQYLPGVRKELKLCEAKTVESSVDEPPEVELKELPPHLEYAFLEGDDKFAVIIATSLKDEEKRQLF
ncbi:hypothetical protein Tco_0597254 [Tanacetum coccineum]